MLSRRSADFWFGLAFIAFSAFIFSQTFGLSRSVVSNSIESAFFPRVLLAAIAGVGLLLICRDFGKAGAGGSERRMPFSFRPFVLLAALGGYVGLMPYAGYYVATALLIPACLLLFDERRWVLHVIVVATFLAVSYGLFDRGFGVLFPKGTLLGH